jgi:hypothetical protein
MAPASEINPYHGFGDPKEILTFLDHHFDLATQSGENHEELIQNVFRAQVGFITIEALKNSDLTPSYLLRLPG